LAGTTADARNAENAKNATVTRSGDRWTESLLSKEAGLGLVVRTVIVRHGGFAIRGFDYFFHSGNHVRSLLKPIVQDRSLLAITVSTGCEARHPNDPG
jgi:hypothetical protein